MEYVRLSLFVTLAHVVVLVSNVAIPESVAAAVAAGHVSTRSLFAAKRLTLRSSDPLTRRSADFMRFGRSGQQGPATPAKKVNVKREAYDFASTPLRAADSRIAAARSTTCVRDAADSSARLICYSPSPIGRRFMLEVDGEDGAEAEVGKVGNDEEVDEDLMDDTLFDDAEKRVNETRPLWREPVSSILEPSVKSRYGRSTTDAATNAANLFDGARASFARARSGENGGQLAPWNGDGTSTSEGDDGPTGDDVGAPLARSVRRYDSFMRLGRMVPSTNPLRYGRSDGRVGDSESARVPRRHSENFMRLGRGATAPPASSSAFERSQRRHSGNFMRLGRNRPAADGSAAFERSQRRYSDNFMRLGRDDERSGARICGLPASQIRHSLRSRSNQPGDHSNAFRTLADLRSLLDTEDAPNTSSRLTRDSVAECLRRFLQRDWPEAAAWSPPASNSTASGPDRGERWQDDDMRFYQIPRTQA